MAQITILVSPGEGPYGTAVGAARHWRDARRFWKGTSPLACRTASRGRLLARGAAAYLAAWHLVSLPRTIFLDGRKLTNIRKQAAKTSYLLIMYHLSFGVAASNTVLWCARFRWTCNLSAEPPVASGPCRVKHGRVPTLHEQEKTGWHSQHIPSYTCLGRHPAMRSLSLAPL